MTNKEFILNDIKSNDFYDDEEKKIKKLINKICNNDYIKYRNEKKMLNEDYEDYETIDNFYSEYL